MRASCVEGEVPRCKKPRLRTKYSVTVCISNSETGINDTFNPMVELINTNKKAELALTNDVFTASSPGLGARVEACRVCMYASSLKFTL